MAIALYPGKFKPPHRGHFEAVKRLLTGEHGGVIFDKESQKDAAGEILKEEKQVENIEKVVIVVGAKTTEGISLEQSLDIWNIYKPYLESYGEVEIIQAEVPVGYTKELLNDKDHFYLAVGLRDITDAPDLGRRSITDKHDNYEALVFTLGPEFNVRATNLRNALKYKQKEEVREFLPDELQDSDKEKIIDILLKGSKKTESALSKKIATQVEGVFNAWFDKEEPVKDPLKEGSGGTPIAPMSAIKSSDRNKLDTLYHRLRNQIGDDFYTIIFNQDHIRIQLKGSGLNETLESESFNFTPHIASILEYMIDEGMNILPIPEVKLVRDEHNAKELFGKTAHYNPVDKEIVLYIEGRHPKDVLRSFAHEMIHHKQNLENRLHNISTTNTNEDDNLLELEKEAYLEGNITFRNWEDGIKNEKSDEVLTEGRYDELTNRVSGTIFDEWKKDIEAGQTQSIFYSSFSSDDSSQPSKKNIAKPISFDVEAALTLVTGSKKLTIDGGASYSPEGEFDDLVRVQFEIDPELLPKFYEKISMNLKDVIRHEIEHLTHGNSDNYNKNKTHFDPIKKEFVPFEDDSLLRDLIDNGLLRPYKYLELPKEVDAMIQGMYFRAKKEKRPFADVVREYLDSQKGVTEEEKEEVLELWRKRLPMLGINQPLEEAQQEGQLNFYLDMDGVLADFDRRFTELSGMHPDEYKEKFGENNFWDFIDEKHKKVFWVGIPLMKGAKNLVDAVKDYNYQILTSPSVKKQSEEGKQEWIKNHTDELFGGSSPLIFFRKSGKKHTIKPTLTKNDILIDDRSKNIDPWIENGGTGILYKNINQVLRDIKNEITSYKVSGKE